MWKYILTLLTAAGLIGISLAQTLPHEWTARPDLETWNTKSVLCKDNCLMRKVDFRNKWVNYLDENGSWQDIQSSFREEGGEFISDQLPFIFKAPLVSTGESAFIANVRYDNRENQ